jgi:hypothetical protein
MCRTLKSASEWAGSMFQAVEAVIVGRNKKSLRFNEIFCDEADYNKAGPSPESPIKFQINF